MPLATLHLLSLAPNASVSKYLRALHSMSITPLVAAKPQRWIITPGHLSKDTLLTTHWDLLLILPATTPLPSTYLGKDWIASHWSITAGVPSAVLKDFHAKNSRLLHPQPGDVPALTGALDNPRIARSAQGLELNDELLAWSRAFPLRDRAVSMLNLLAFHATPEAHASYARYGKAFAETIGSKRGGNAKVVGKVVGGQGTGGEDASGWDEVALAHYPTGAHFVDMLGSADYQEVNARDRVPALRDTCILCTSELDEDVHMGESAKL